MHFLRELVIVKCENEFFNFHKVVQRQFLGKAAKLLFAREQIMSVFCVPKILNSVNFSSCYLKNKNVDVFLRHTVVTLIQLQLPYIEY